MALSQFDLARILRCPATNEEGFSCLHPPSHNGEHRWDRCETSNSEGHRCMLPFRHPGSHELLWYDHPAAQGQTHTLNYGGSLRETEALAATVTRIAARYGWVRQSQTLRPGLFWRWPPLTARLSRAMEPQGRLTVVFEFRPPEVLISDSQGVSDIKPWDQSEAVLDGSAAAEMPV